MKEKGVMLTGVVWVAILCGSRAGDSLFNSSTSRILSSDCKVSQQAKNMAFEANPLLSDENR